MEGCPREEEFTPGEGEKACTLDIVYYPFFLEVWASANLLWWMPWCSAQLPCVQISVVRHPSY